MKNLLILFINLLFAITANAQPELTTQVSGFITSTNFSDNRWYNDTQTAAINLDVIYDDMAIRGQLASPFTDSLRRLVVEKSFWVKEGHETLLQIGRLPRLASFYNSVTDAPGTSGFAMLPLGEYNRRLVQNRTFNTVDGINGIYTIRSSAGLLNFHADYGTLPMEDQCFTQNELTKKKCIHGYEFVGEDANYDAGVSFISGPWELMGYVGSIKMKTNLVDSKDAASVVLSNSVQRLSYDLTKIGVKYSEQKWWIQSEYLATDLKLQSKGNSFSTVQTSENIYILGGYNWTDAWSTYAEYSYGKSSSGNFSLDRAIGTTYVYNNSTFSLEYHEGAGLAWKKYLETVPTWNSFVFSFTQRF